MSVDSAPVPKRVRKRIMAMATYCVTIDLSISIISNNKPSLTYWWWYSHTHTSTTLLKVFRLVESKVCIERTTVQLEDGRPPMVEEEALLLDIGSRLFFLSVHQH
jgi:hypothetical protein